MKSDQSWVGFFCILGMIVLPTGEVLAQSVIVPDGTLGNERSRVTPLDATLNLPLDSITQGAQRGQNLFHSFRDFNVAPGRGVYFFVPNAEVRNILTRVTGTTRSDILGTIGTFRPSDNVLRVPNVNVFLINPNGVVFGETASLDVGGSVLVTTANAVQLGTNGLFSASQPIANNLLSVNPSTFLFNAIAQQAEIVNQAALQVSPDQSLILLGGNIRLDRGSIQALGGRIEIGGLTTPGRVALSINPSLSLNFLEQPSNADIDLNQATIVLASTGIIKIQGRLVTFNKGSQITSITQDNVTGGDILIQANQLNLNEASTIGAITVGSGSGGKLTLDVQQLNLQDASTLTTATIVGQGKAGDLNIQASESIQLSSNSAISSLAIGNRQSETIGSGGDVTIVTKNLKVDEAGIASNAFLGEGRGGNLTIEASDSIDLINGALNVSSYGTGSGGDLLIKTRNLNLQDGAIVSTSAFSPTGALEGSLQSSLLSNTVFRNFIESILIGIDPSLLGNVNSGNITIIATDTVKVESKVNGNGNGKSRDVSLLSTRTSGSGRAGDLTIQTRRLLINPGGWISTDAGERSSGKGGNLTINASESIEMRGNLKENNIALLSSLTDGSGDSGNIFINAKSLTLTDGKIASESKSQGNAGEIKINLQDSLNASVSDISTASIKSSGGLIGITARDIRLNNDSDIKTTVLGGTGNGGNIILTARSIVALNDSDILAFARNGKGGNVTLNTRAFFGQKYRAASPGTNPVTLDGNDRVDINASGRIFGTIILPDVSFIQNSLNPLPKETIDTNALLSQTCIVRKDKPNGTFYITGTDGLPNRPSDLSSSQYPTNTIQPTQTATRPWQKGDPIVEPQGFYTLTNGRLIMSRECKL